jgi:hypothetical protein
VKVVVAILLIATVPVYARAQSPRVRVSKDDAQKIMTSIGGDKAACSISTALRKLT